MIHRPDSRLVVVGGNHLFELSASGAEFRAAWTGIVFSRRILGARQFIIEGDSASTMS